jgi:2'-5' RNA ligase
MDLRCFISIELPEALKGEIASLTEDLRDAGADARWIKAENLHLTLKFLGNIPEETLPGIEESLKKAVRTHMRFKLRFSGAGVFPGRKRPRVVWIGIQDSDRLVGLQQDVESSMAELGFEAEGRPYSPHLTLGRLKSPRRRDVLLEELDVLSEEEFGEVEVTEVALMRSTLRPTGAEYSRLCGIPLGHP